MNDYPHCWECFSTFTSLFHLLLLIGNNNGEDRPITDCAKGPPGRKRPTVPPEYCHDLDSPACNVLFPKLPATYLSNLNA